MPTNRTFRTRTRRGVDEFRIEELLSGTGASFLAGVGYLGHHVTRSGGCVFTLDELGLADRAAALSEMRSDWIERRDELLKAWITRDEAFQAKFPHAKLGGPGTRPWAWWAFDAPDDDVRPDETEGDYLTRHGLLLPGEHPT